MERAYNRIGKINHTKFFGILTFLFGVLMVHLSCLSQTPNPPVIFSGNVYSSDSLKAVPFATIMDKRTKSGTVSDENGYFIIQVKASDTLVISSVGFSSREYIVPPASKNFYDKIVLDPKTYELDEVGIYAYKNYQGFKQDFIALDLPEQKTAYIPPPTSIYSGNTSPTMTFNAPFTMIYNKFNKRVKEEKKVAGLKIEHTKRQQAMRKYNKEFVASVLKIKDKELEDFMQFCQLKDDYIISASEYDLALAIKQCYTSFRN